MNSKLFFSGKMLLLAAALSFVSCKENPETEPKQPVYDHTDLKIMSFNIAVDNRQENKGWAWRKTAVYNMLEAEMPDVIGFQEAQAHEITGMLRARPEYAWYGLGRDSGKVPSTASEDYSAEESMAIFWLKDSLSIGDHGTFWLSETPETVSMGWDAAYIRTLTWAKFTHKRTGAEFFIFNTHLDNKGATARSESMKLIIRKMAELNPKGLPAYLMADFNTTEKDAIFTELLTVMDSARANAIASEASKKTYNGYTLTGTAQIDHIFYSGGKQIVKSFRVLDGNYGSTYISDHYPIVASFYVRNLTE